MKNTLIISLFFLTSCITVNTTSTGFKDEIYYSAEDYELNENVQTEIVSEEYSEQNSEDMSEVEYVDEYSSDDYYDYGYSSRIRRFHSPYIGFGYYHNFYTNSYWYNYNPYNYGVSIYYGYNFWHPHYYNPHHYHGYHNYYSLHDHYYYNSYYAGLSYPTYFNSYDNNSTYYGPRQNFNVQKTPDSFANRFADEKEKLPVYNINRVNNGKLNNVSNSVRPINKPNSNISTNRPFVKPQNINTRPATNNNNLQQINNSVNKPVYNKPSNNFSKPSYKKPTQSNTIKSPSRSPSNSIRTPSRSPSRNSSRSPSRSNTSRPR
jgi:hypothetical protein